MMQVVRGIYLPNDDTHFPGMLRRAPLFEGRGSYQLNKAIPAIRLTEPQNRRVALDIGAHVGLWSMVLSKHFRTVHAFEPLPAHIECFERNLIHCKNVHLHGMALGNENGIGGIEPVNGNSGNAHMVSGVALMAVTLQRLDDIALPGALDIPHADFIKIDVEGYEWHVVTGAENFIKSSKPVMVVEQKPGNSERYGHKTGEVIELLRSWGARVEWEKSGDYCLKWGTG